MTATEYASEKVSPVGIWTRTRCGRGHLAEHPNGVDQSDFCDCWCGAPRVAATVFRMMTPAELIETCAYTPLDDVRTQLIGSGVWRQP
jgi:hypothetical protein